MSRSRTATLFAWMSILAVSPLCGQAMRAIAPRDCVTVQYLSKDDIAHGSLQVNAQGTRIAYLVKSPNLATNTNDMLLFVRSVDPNPLHEARLLIRGDDISEIHWMPDGQHLTVLIHDDARRIIVAEVDAVTGKRQILAKSDSDIVEYTIDQAGDEIVFATEVARKKQDTGPTGKQIATGYRIEFAPSSLQYYSKRKLFITRRVAGGAWTSAQPISISSPFTGQKVSEFAEQGSNFLSLSPDGMLLSLSYISGNELPDDWKADPFIRRGIDVGFPGTQITVLQDVTHNRTTIPFKTSWASSVPFWSDDSRSFAVIAQSPIGSKWEHDDEINHRTLSHAAFHLFWVDSKTDDVQLIAPVIEPYTGQQVLSWRSNADLVVRTASDTVTVFAQDSGGWMEKSRIHIPLEDISRHGQLVGDEKGLIGEYQTTVTPAELFMYQPGRNDVQILVKLNPQFDQLSIAPVRNIQWKTSNGFQVHGLLFMPTDYVEGEKYPLVIGTKPQDGRFVCDEGDNHFPSFAPQPIANAGMFYLTQFVEANDSAFEMERYFPDGYPGIKGIGGVAEAAFQMDIWDSAVNTLANQGLIDKDKVGLIGFSRSGWYTEFALTHSAIHYRAATATDNVQYSLGEYWGALSEDNMRSLDNLYGGPPFGETRENWSNFSISFQADKIHTPLLLEVMGHGVQYDTEDSMPLNLMTHLEVFSELHHLNRPVDLYYYPNEDHQPEHPQARLGSLQRNLDWYRFWLQGYERPNPEDPDQYKHWEHLRKLRDADEKAAKLTGGTP